MLKYVTNPDKNPFGGMLFISFYESYCEYSGCTEHQAMACMRYLADKGYVKFGYNQNGLCVGFELEHKAYQRAAFTRETILSFLIKSVLVPILVSVIVTFATLIALNLAKESLPQWLSRLLQ